jgi:hypothetical protein
MNRDDDQTWLEALAGRAPAGEGGGAAREAERLRAGILARQVEEPPPVPAQDARREAALIARARREGLIPGTVTASRRWWAGWRGAAVLAATACLVVIGFLVRPARIDETVRGAPGGMVRLEDEHPERLQRSIVNDLRSAGVVATPYERLGRLGIDADLPVPVPPEVAKVLGRHRIPVPSDGVLTVEIAPRAGK